MNSLAALFGGGPFPSIFKLESSRGFAVHFNSHIFRVGVVRDSGDVLLKKLVLSFGHHLRPLVAKDLR